MYIDKQVRMNWAIGMGWLLVLAIILAWDAINGRETNVGPYQETVAAFAAMLAIAFMVMAMTIRMWHR
jgi:hypothetical protein